MQLFMMFVYSITDTMATQCQIPSSSPDDYIIPYNGMDERIRVTFACQSGCGADDLKFSLELHTAVCASSGDLELNPFKCSM